MASELRFYAAACQTDLPNPLHRDGIGRQVSHMLAMIDRAVVGYAPIGSVRLVVFPEFGHAAPIYPTVEELRDRLAVSIPNDHTDRYRQKAREHGLYIQTASFLECDDRLRASRRPEARQLSLSAAHGMSQGARCVERSQLRSPGRGDGRGSRGQAWLLRRLARR